MCGRFLSLTFEEIQDLLDDSDGNLPLDPIVFGEVFPTNNCLVRLKEGFTTMPWGVLPNWKKAKAIINARHETINTKTFFKNDFHEHRCIIYAKGFYEWDKEKPKNRFEVKREDQEIMYFAGIYQIENNQPKFMIITQEATKEFMSIHNRLPLILEENEVEDYLKVRDVNLWTEPKYPKIQWKIIKS